MDWVYGTQGWAGSACDLWINHCSDFVPVFLNALFRVIASPTASTIAEPRFWVRRARLRVVITNASQLDCLLTVFPWYIRRGQTFLYPSTLFDASSNLETLASAGGTGAILGTSTTLGWSPYQSKVITEAVKLGKPKKYRIPGGQSVEYNVVDKKPVYLDYNKLGGSTHTTPGNFAFMGVPYHTRGCFLQFQSSVINDSVTAAEIDQGPGHCNVQVYKTFEWVAASMPYHFSDVVTNAADISAFHIVQPQTGVINTTPSFV